MISNKKSNINLDDIKQIEEDIHMINECFKTLDTIISEQGTQIDTIEEMMIQSKTNVIVANQELEKAAEYKYSYDKFIAGGIIGGVLSGVISYGLSIPISLGSIAGGGLIGTYFGSKI